MTPADSNTEYAYWTAPEESFTVTYSLAVFHEIDFEVNEGFRRIPHGGIETGALLFGKLAQNSATIEAFRAIECEHASGPSFNLSERDVERLREQLAAAASDPELAGFEVLGWMVAHTRSPLQMNGREVVLFDELFPGPGKIMLLAKPERFQPTRFGFIVRSADGRVDPDAAPSAIILPLPGRAGRAAETPAASIPAPIQRTVIVVSPPPAPEALPADISSEVEPPPAQLPMAAEPPPPPSEIAAPSFWRDIPVGPREEPILRIQEPSSSTGEVKVPAVPPSAGPAEALPSIDEIRRKRAEKVQPPDPIEGRQRVTRKMPGQGGRPGLRLLALLFLAAIAGCGLGYLAYLQLPSATIPLTIQRQASSFVVSWPVQDTSDALSAEIRVNDEEPKPLSIEQRAVGNAVVAARGDSVKVEVIVQHRLRHSRGIVRYVRAGAGGV